MRGSDGRRRALELLRAGAGPCRVKCCGMTREDDIAAVNAARPDMCGFVVDFPKSRRSCSPGRVRELAALLDPAVLSVGVFVDADPSLAASLAADGALDAVQLHGHEDAAYVERLRGLAGVAVIQAFEVRSPEDVERANASPADMVLLDNGQGTGEGFDWSLLAGARRPYILAGGLNPGNVARAARELAPWGVDMSSGLETDGLKDPAKIEAAVAAVRSLNDA